MSSDIILDDVSRTYGTAEEPVAALSNLNLEIRAGAIVALSGRSGSGKSTCLNIIGAIEQPSSGRVFVGGVETTAFNDAQATSFRNHEVGFVFQDFNLIPVLTAYENVEVALYLKTGGGRSGDRASILRVLEQVGLAGLDGRLPRQLSGGQQQRVSIARALVKSPNVLLADEPTANLDTKTAADILSLIQDLSKRQGMTTIFSTHDPRALEIADTVIYLGDGRRLENPPSRARPMQRATDAGYLASEGA